MMNSLTVKLSFKLLKGTFNKRMNRFLAEIELNNRKVLAHLPNSGRMLTVFRQDAKPTLRQKTHPTEKPSIQCLRLNAKTFQL